MDKFDINTNSTVWPSCEVIEDIPLDSIDRMISIFKLPYHFDASTNILIPFGIFIRYLVLECGVWKSDWFRIEGSIPNAIYY